MASDSRLYKAPNVFVKRSKFFLHCQQCPCIVNRCLNLEPVSDDPFISQKAFDSLGVVFGNSPPIKIVERLPVVVAFPQNRDPAQSRLRPFKNEHLEKSSVIVLGQSPLAIVILDIERIRCCPRTTCLFFRHCASKRGLRPAFHHWSHGDTAQNVRLPGEIPPIKVTSAATASAANTVIGKGDGAGSCGSFMYIMTAIRM